MTDQGTFRFVQSQLNLVREQHEAVVRGDITAANAIDITATNIDLNGTTYTSTTTTIDFAGPVDLDAAGLIVISGGGGNGDDITFSTTLDGPQAVSVGAAQGDVYVLGAIGGTGALTALTITGNDIELNGIGARETVNLGG